MKKLQDGSTIVQDGMSLTIVNDNERIPLEPSISAHYFNDLEGGVFFQRELEYIKANSYDVKYADLMARTLFPVSNSAGEGVTNITYRTYDQSGSAEIISDYAKDLPRSDIGGKETTVQVKDVGSSFAYSVKEIAQSRLTGKSLDQRRSNSASRAIEQKINEIAFFGDSTSGLIGLFTDPNVPVSTVVDGGTGTEWVNKTPDQILFDVNDLFSSIDEVTLGKERANTLLLPRAQYNYISATARSANSDTTILNYLVMNSPFLSSMADVIPINECSASNNPEFSNDVMVAYDRNPENVELEIPLEKVFYAAQQENLAFKVPVKASIAGLIIYYPLSFAIGEGI